jgi:dimeric dUTPase (all-alpha-NTP-PPase superfamily)
MRADFTKIISAQSQLDNDIYEKYSLNGIEVFPKKILALLTEIGECANEDRCFKYWSEDQEPRSSYIVECDCPNCIDCSLYYEPENLILNEYVDCFHFIVSHGLDKGFMPSAFQKELNYKTSKESRTIQFIQVYESTIDYWRHPSQTSFIDLLGSFIELGHLLGFEWDEIEAAYFRKNEENLKRLESGY